MPKTMMIVPPSLLGLPPLTTMRRVLQCPLLVTPSNRLFSAVARNNNEDEDGEEDSSSGSIDNGDTGPLEARETWMDYFNGLKKHLDEVRQEKGLSEDDPVHPTTLFYQNWVSKQRYYHKIGRRLDPNGTNERCVELLESIGGRFTRMISFLSKRILNSFVLQVLRHI
jgi:hypothetical protein